MKTKKTLAALLLACIASLNFATLEAKDIFIAFGDYVEPSEKRDATRQAVSKELKKQLESKGYRVLFTYPQSGCQCVGFVLRTVGNYKTLRSVEFTVTHASGILKTLGSISITEQVEPSSIPYKLLVDPEWMARKLIQEMRLDVPAYSMSNASATPLATTKSSTSVKSRGRLTDEERDLILRRMRSGGKINKKTQTMSNWNR